MLLKHDSCRRLLNSIKRNYLRLFVLFCCIFTLYSHSLFLHGEVCNDMDFDNRSEMTDPYAFEDLKVLGHCKKHNMTYYLYISDFAQSFIEIPTSNVSGDSSTISSKYLAGRATIYDPYNKESGTCSASFLCMQNADGIFTDISNYFSADSGLIVSWFTPTTLINLELDSIIRSMVTKCIVLASTKIGFNPFYGQEFDLVVSSDDEKIYFKFTKR